MSTLLLRLAAPLQSWGINSNFDTRTTERYPSKSGVVGLLAAALGVHRGEDEELSRLCSLRFGIRVDREGALLRDFHAAHIWRPGVKHPAGKDSYVTYRYYLADAVFLAGMESADDAFLCELDEAVHHPAFPLFLGRRACPPTLPLSLGIREGVGLREALEQERWLAPDWYQKRQKRRGGEAEKLRILMDTAPEDRNGVSVRDVPESFSPYHRKYGYRGVMEFYASAVTGEENGKPLETETAPKETEHDPFLELEGGDVPEQTGT